MKKDGNRDYAALAQGVICLERDYAALAQGVICLERATNSPPAVAIEAAADYGASCALPLGEPPP